ncbi:MAG TPA: response regulator [Candidatus Acidoferrales bacterium]
MPRILVADDNSNIQKMVALAFQDHGIEVIAVGNGEAAVRKLPDLNPDVVLADVFMPVRNGYEVCEFIKKDPRFSKIPVILLVGAFDPLDEAEARRVGADGILKKPFVPPDPLIAMVTSVMAKAPKPEPKAEAPVLEIPKPSPPPPPAPFPHFPEPTPEEEAYAFGTGRRSLDDDEGAAGSSQSAHVAVTSAAEFSTEHFASAEEEAGASETSVDWRRRDEVNSAEVPSFSAALMDEPAAQSVAESNAGTEPLASAGVPDISPDNLPDSPILTEEPSGEPASSESFMRAFAGAFDDPPPAQIEEPAPPPSPAWLKPIEDSFQSPKSLSELSSPAPANSSDWNVSERAESRVETAAPAAETNAPEVQAAAPTTPAIEPATTNAAPEVALREIPAVESPEPESFAFEPTAADVAANVAAPVAIDAESELPENIAPHSMHETDHPAQPWNIEAGTAQTFSSVDRAPVAAYSESGGISAAEFESVTRVEETAEEPLEEIDDAGPLASAISILESAGIAAREIGRIPTPTSTVDAAVAAPKEPETVTQEASSASAPAAEPSAASQAEVATPLAEKSFERTNAPEGSTVFAQPDSQMLPVEAAPEPTASSAASTETPAPAALAEPPVATGQAESHPPAAQAESSVSAAPAQAAPSVDEVVARVLEKLGPQLQELLSKNLVRPLVEDLLHKPDEKK